MDKYVAKKGDRVLYVGQHRPDWHGNPATVERVAGNNHVTLRFDKPHSGNEYQGLGFMINDLVPYAEGLDPSKPLVIANDSGEKHPVTLIGVLHDKQLIVDVAGGSRMDRGWYIYDRKGKFVRSATGGGSATRLENKPEPVITKAYINVGRSAMNGGKGLVDSSIGKTGHDLGVATIEVTLTDGLVTGAELVQPGKVPVTVHPR